MIISHSFPITTLLLFLLSPVSAMAAAGLDLCNDVLQNDVFNRSSGSSQSAESERQAYLESFFSSDVNNAYNEYKKARSQQNNSSTSIHAEGHYGIIGGEFDLSTEHGSAMSMEDFSKQFNDRKELRRSQSSGSAARASSLISTFQTAIRDPNTIEAWRQCMLSRTSDPSIITYGYRDNSGNPYLTVMWLPGRALASIAPQVDVRFISPDPDVVVDVGPAPVTISPGSGKAFVLRLRNPDSKARFQGFSVLVNATARDGMRQLMDFQQEAIVPGVLSAVPCNIFIRSGVDYRLFIFMPVFTSAEALPNSFMVLSVGQSLPVTSDGLQEFSAQVSFDPETAKKLLAATHNSPRTIRMVTTANPAWLGLEGSTIKLKMPKSLREPSGLDDRAGLGQCTADQAEGTFPSGSMMVKFKLLTN